MGELTFKSDKEELQFYREYNAKTISEISDEIHKLLDLNPEYPKGITLMQIGKIELLRLKNAIINKLKKEE